MKRPLWYAPGMKRPVEKEDVEARGVAEQPDITEETPISAAISR